MKAFFIGCMALCFASFSFAEEWRSVKTYDDNTLTFYQAGETYWLLDAGNPDTYELILEKEPGRKYEVTWGEADELSRELSRRFSIPNLTRTVVFQSERMTAKRWRELAEIPESFRLELTGVTDAQVAEIVRECRTLPRLVGVGFACADTVTDAGILPLAKIPTLVSLDLHGCRNLTDAGIAQWTKAGAKELRRLRLPNQLSDAGITAAAQGFPKLEILWAENNDQLTDVGLAALKSLRSLKELNLSFCGALTDQGLRELGGVPSLEHLYLNGCRNFTPKGLESLQGLPRLKNVLLYGWGK